MLIHHSVGHVLLFYTNILRKVGFYEISDIYLSLHRRQIVDVSLRCVVKSRPSLILKT